jgi:hypothetical protein
MSSRAAQMLGYATAAWATAALCRWVWLSGMPFAGLWFYRIGYTDRALAWRALAWPVAVPYTIVEQRIKKHGGRDQ